MFEGVIVAGAIANGPQSAQPKCSVQISHISERDSLRRGIDGTDDCKAMLVRETSADLLYSDAINGTPAMWMKASMRRVDSIRTLPRPTGRKSASPPAARQALEDFWSAGHGIGLTHDVPKVAELVLRLRGEYQSACATPSWPRQLETDDE